MGGALRSEYDMRAGVMRRADEDNERRTDRQDGLVTYAALYKNKLFVAAICGARIRCC